MYITFILLQNCCFLPELQTMNDNSESTLNGSLQVNEQGNLAARQFFPNLQKHLWVNRNMLIPELEANATKSNHSQ